jgi:hypothetical protein
MKIKANFAATLAAKITGVPHLRPDFPGEGGSVDRAAGILGGQNPHLCTNRKDGAPQKRHNTENHRYRYGFGGVPHLRPDFPGEGGSFDRGGREAGTQCAGSCTTRGFGSTGILACLPAGRPVRIWFFIRRFCGAGMVTEKKCESAQARVPVLLGRFRAVSAISCAIAVAILFAAASPAGAQVLEAAASPAAAETSLSGAPATSAARANSATADARASAAATRVEANAHSGNATRAGVAAAYASATQPIGLFAAPQGTVGFGEAYRFVAHSSDPSDCEEGSVEFNLSSGTPKFCSAPNTWTAFTSGGGATFAGGSTFSLQYNNGAGFGGIAAPSVNGTYYCGYAPSGSVAVAPTCWLNSIAPRAVTGTTATDTILYSDMVVNYQGSVAVATSLPTPGTLGNSGFYARLNNFTSGSATAITVTAAGSFTFASTGSSTLTIAQGAGCALTVDPAGSVWDDACNDFQSSAGSGIAIARGQFGPTISVTSAPTATVAAALAATPAQCSGSQFATGIAASGNANCSAIPTLNQNTTGNAATATVATALAATPTQCSGAQFATGIAASGNANCATPGGSSFSAATATLFDDFMSNSAISTLGWVANGGGGSLQPQPTAAGLQFANHPGVMQLNSGGAGGGTDWEYYILGNQNNAEMNPTANSFTIYADVINAGGTSSAVTGTIRFGLFDHTSMNQEAPNSAIYFEAAGTGGGAPTWNCVVNTSGTATSASSGVTAPVGTSTFHVLQIIFSASTSVSFAIDGSAVCAGLSATVPSALMDAAFEATDNSSGAGSEIIDYFRMDMNLTR